MRDFKLPSFKFTYMKSNVLLGSLLAGGLMFGYALFPMRSRNQKTAAINKDIETNKSNPKSPISYWDVDDTK